MPWFVKYQVVTHNGKGTQESDFTPHPARHALDPVSGDAAPYEGSKALAWLEESARETFALEAGSGVSLFAQSRGSSDFVQLVSDRLAHGLMMDWWENGQDIHAPRCWHENGKGGMEGRMRPHNGAV